MKGFWSLILHGTYLDRNISVAFENAEGNSNDDGGGPVGVVMMSATTINLQHTVGIGPIPPGSVMPEAPCK